MTAILAWHDGERGYMAADRRNSSGSEICSDSAHKIVRCGHWLIGCAGETLAEDFVRSNADALGEAETSHELSRALRKVFENEGWSPRQRGDSIDAPGVGASLLAVHPTLGNHVVFFNLAVRAQDRPCQTGSGGAIACGAFEALRRYGRGTVEERMREAIEIACMYDSACGGQPEVMTTITRAGFEALAAGEVE